MSQEVQELSRKKERVLKVFALETLFCILKELVQVNESSANTNSYHPLSGQCSRFFLLNQAFSPMIHFCIIGYAFESHLIVSSLVVWCKREKDSSNNADKSGFLKLA